MTTQLEVVNNALALCEEPPLTSLALNTEATRQCNAHWPQAVRSAFEVSTPNFALRRVQLNTFPTAPAFGYRAAYQKPADWVRTVSLSPSGKPMDPMRSFVDEGGLILTDDGAAFMVYVSSGFFTLLGAWPAVFADFVAAELAQRVAPKLSSADNIKQFISAEYKRRKSLALGFDAQQNPPAQIPPGRWASAPRTGYRNTPQGA